MNEETSGIDGYQRDAMIAEIRRDDAYKALGILVYDMAKRGQISDPRIAELTERIDLSIYETASGAAAAREETRRRGYLEKKEGMAEKQGEVEIAAQELPAEEEELAAVVIICPHCGGEAEEGSVFCRFWGCRC